MGVRVQNVVKVNPTGAYPCQWDDLIGADRETLATIYTLSTVKREGFKPGITMGKDGVYDIVVPDREISYAVVRRALKDLERATGMPYALVS